MPVSESMRARNRLGAYVRNGRPEDDPEVIAARAALELAKATDKIRDGVAAALELARTDPKIRAAIEAAPPLSAEQISELRDLLAPAGRAAE